MTQKTNKKKTLIGDLLLLILVLLSLYIQHSLLFVKIFCYKLIQHRQQTKQSLAKTTYTIHTDIRPERLVSGVHAILVFQLFSLPIKGNFVLLRPFICAVFNIYVWILLYQKHPNEFYEPQPFQTQHFYFQRTQTNISNYIALEDL